MGIYDMEKFILERDRRSKRDEEGREAIFEEKEKKGEGNVTGIYAIGDKGGDGGYEGTV